MKRSNILAIYFILAVLLLLLGETKPFTFVRGKIQYIFSPITHVFFDVSQSTGSFTSTLFEINNLSRENGILKSENRDLKSKVTELQEVKYRVGVLEKELGLQGVVKDRKFVAAAVVGRSPSLIEDILTIDKGSQDGISINQPLISNGFLIGKIIKVFPNTSQVELITSHKFLATVVLQDSRHLGLLKGGLNGLIIEQLPVDGKISPNENVVTRGLAGELPAGIPVGSVKDVISKPSDIFKTVTLVSPVNLNQIEIVLILLDNK